MEGGRLILFLWKPKINSFEKGVSKEWIARDGRDSFAAITLFEVPTKDFHALFCKNGEPLLVKFEEKIKVGRKECFISTNRYSGVVYPDGYRYIVGVEFNPFPTYIYSINEALVKKRVLFVGENLLVNYSVVSCIEPVHFEISPLLPKTSEDFPVQHNIESGTIVDVSRDRFKVIIKATSGEYKARFKIYENVEYMDSGEKRVFWSPGTFVFSLKNGESVTLEVSSQAKLTDLDFDKLWGMKKRLYKSLLERVPCKDAFLSALLNTGSFLVVDRSDLKTIVSGYPSLREDAMSTFVSLPGLLLAGGRLNDAKLCFLRWFDYFKDERGIPFEIMEERGIYKGVDSTLWLIFSLGKFLAYTNDVDFVRPIYPKLIDFVGYLLESKRVDNDGLLIEEDPSYNWMGIKVNEEFIVERKGKLIEINALWYNALCLLRRIADVFNIKYDYEFLLDKVRENFIRTFWLAEEEYFKDSDEAKELRPNQVIALSLPFVFVPKEVGRKALNSVWRHLYTTYGLRTLAPLDKKYKGREEGDEIQRIKARFRGMAWPWLLGHFFTALRRYFPEKKHVLETMWMPYTAHIEEGCIGGIAEVFDGSMPYEAHGDILYAPSQGEVIRSFIEDVREVRPPYEDLWSEELI
ncbi:MAG: hypothetical protein PWQ16_1285 [bacterium]|nr:hypothetical protein [bacterium]